MLGMVYVIFRAMFPESKLLRAIGEAFSRIPGIAKKGK